MQIGTNKNKKHKCIVEILIKVMTYCIDKKKENCVCVGVCSTLSTQISNKITESIWITQALLLRIIQMIYTYINPQTSATKLLTLAICKCERHPVLIRL